MLHIAKKYYFKAILPSFYKHLELDGRIILTGLQTNFLYRLHWCSLPFNLAVPNDIYSFDFFTHYVNDQPLEMFFRSWKICRCMCSQTSRTLELCKRKWYFWCNWNIRQHVVYIFCYEQPVNWRSLKGLQCAYLALSVLSKHEVSNNVSQWRLSFIRGFLFTCSCCVSKF